MQIAMESRSQAQAKRSRGTGNAAKVCLHRISAAGQGEERA